MSKSNMYGFEDWRDHLEDYVIVRHEKMTSLGMFTSFYAYDIRKKKAYTLEDANLRQRLVDEMIEAGVKTISFKESIAMIYREKFATEELFEKFWQKHFGGE